MIPSFAATIDYVTSELDEIEKEEFFRLKKVLKVKIRNEELAKLEEAGLTEEGDEAAAAVAVPVRTINLSATPASTQPHDHVAPGAFAEVVSAAVAAAAATTATPAPARASLPLSPSDDAQGISEAAAAAAAAPLPSTDPFSNFD